MSHSTALSRPADRLADVLFHYLHGTLLSIGFAVTLIFAGTLLAGELPNALRSLADSFANLTHSAPHESNGTTEDDSAKLSPALQSVADAIAKRYRIATPAVEEIVRTSIIAARSANLDPMLVLAVIGVESRFNPYAESPFGAQGLMQIIGKFHTDKFEIKPDGLALLDPVTNIQVGVQIIKEYRRRTGTMDAALKLYGGESDENAGSYAEKVYAEKARLDQVLSRVKVSTERRLTSTDS